MYKYLLVLLLSINVSYATVTGKLVDMLVQSDGVEKIMAKEGGNAADAKLFQQYVTASIKSLGKDKKQMTKDELTKSLVFLQVKGKEATMRKDLQLLLSKDASKVSQADLEEAMRSLIYFADRYGHSVIKQCVDCLSGSVKGAVDFGIATVTDPASKKLLEVIPKEGKPLDQYISIRMSKLGMGSSAVSPVVVKSEEQRTLALFLGLAESGSADQKALAASIKNLSTGKDGKADLLNPSAPNKLWKIVGDKQLEPEVMKNWTRTLDTAADRARREGISGEEAFYRTMEDMAGKDQDKLKAVRDLRKQRCFFS